MSGGEAGLSACGEFGEAAGTAVTATTGLSDPGGEALVNRLAQVVIEGHALTSPACVSVCLGVSGCVRTH